MEPYTVEIFLPLQQPGNESYWNLSAVRVEFVLEDTKENTLFLMLIDQRVSLNIVKIQIIFKP